MAMARNYILAAAALAVTAAFAGALALVAPPPEVEAPATAPAEEVPRAEISASAPADGDEEPATDAEPAAPLAEPQEVARRIARDVTPPGIRSGAIRNMPERPPQPEPEPEPVTHTYHRVVISEAGAFEAGDVRVRLAGITAPGLDDECKRRNGETWACGRAATSALRRLVRTRAVECDIVSETAEGVEGRCSVGGQNIGDWLVDQGWAIPRGDSPQTYGGIVAADKRSGPVAPRVDIPEPMAPLSAPGSIPAAATAPPATETQAGGG